MEFFLSMDQLRLFSGVLVCGLWVSAVSDTALAQLPALDDKPWLGYYAAVEHKRFNLGVTAQGKISLIPMGRTGKPVAHNLAIPILVGIEEMQPNGQYSLKEIQPATLESSSPATDKLENAVIRGKVTGDASFEVTLEHERGVISIGGRMLDPGKLKGASRFVIRMRFPNAYAQTRKARDKNDEKDFQKQVKGDRIDLKWTDGKRKKQAMDEKVDASSKDINGPGIAAAEVEISSYQGRNFYVSSSENANLSLWNGGSAPLNQGFTFVWTPEAAKDPEGKARLSIELK